MRGGQERPAGRRRMGRAVLVILAVGAVLLLPDHPSVRPVLAAPLVVADAGAGEVAYVPAAAFGVWQERLRTAADLVHLGRVKQLMLPQLEERGAHHYGLGQPLTATGWAVAYLEWLGVPPDRIQLVPPGEGWLGTLSEGRAVAAHWPEDAHTLVVVTSAPHTRRARLAFQRALGEAATVRVVPATSFAHSAEQDAPLWLEYGKLLLYWVAAW